MSRFSCNFQVRYSEVDVKGELSPPALIRYLEEVATAHSESHGVGIEKLSKRGEGWVLHNWAMEYHKPPHLEDRIIITTWASAFHHFNAIREFIVSDEMGNPLAYASSRWIYINIRRLRPVRLPEDVTSNYGFDDTRALDCEFTPLTFTGQMKYEQTITPGLFALDTNKHVNNTRYIEWMLNQLDLDFYMNHRLSRLEVEYNRPSYLADDLIVSLAPALKDINKEPFIRYEHQVVHPDDKKPRSLAHSWWIPNNSN